MGRGTFLTPQPFAKQLTSQKNGTLFPEPLTFLVLTDDSKESCLYNGMYRIFLLCRGKVKQELQVTSSNPQVTSSNRRVKSSNSRVTSSNARVTSSNPRVRRLKARVARLKAQVSRLKARFEAIKLRVRLM